MSHLEPARRAVLVALALSGFMASAGAANADDVDAWRPIGKKLCRLFRARDQVALGAIATRRSEKVAVRLRAAALARDLGDRSLDSLAVDIFPTERKDIFQIYDVDWATERGTWSIQLIAALAAEGNDRAIEKIFGALPYTDAGLTMDL